MKLEKVRYSELNSRQKENFNFHKVAAALADYGYNAIRLTDDWEGADFIAVHIDGETMIRVQLKGRFTINQKYLGKEIFIAFIEKGQIKIYSHDEAVKSCDEKILNSYSWKELRGYSWNQTPRKFDSIISII